MSSITLKAHFDGQSIHLDEPFELTQDAQLLVTVLPSANTESEPEVLTPTQLNQIETWIQDVEARAADVDADDGPRLQAAVAEIRRQARELARRGVETSP